MLWRTPTALLCMATNSVRFSTSVRTMATHTTMTAPTSRGSSKRFLIIDTDSGFDDLVALHCLLNTRTRTHQSQPQPPPILVTTVGGVVSAPRGSHVLRGLFPVVPIAVGLNCPIMPFDPLPDWLVNYRTETLDAFAKDMNIPIHNPDDNNDDTDACRKAVSRILEAPKDHSVDILAIGPLTNLSDWLTHVEQNPEDSTMGERFASKIHSIYILGGNHPSHAWHEPEFNFGLDPSAARHVLLSPLLRDKVHLITSSVCNMGRLNDVVGHERIQAFIEEQRRPNPRSTSSNDERCGFYRTLLQYDTMAYSLSCDPVCAFALEHPECVTWEHVSVSVDAISGKLVPAENDSDGGGSSGGSVIRMASDIHLNKYLSWISTTVDSRQTILNLP